jgi:hypothetical protein
MSEMQADTSDLIVRFVAQASAAAELLADQHHLPIEYAHVQEALEDTLHVARSEHLLSRPLDTAAICDTLKTYDFRPMFPVVLGMVEMSDSIIPPGALRRIDEKTIKSKGEVWRIHQNDADPFPSNPHAINLESGLKLDLSTGDLYRKTAVVDAVSKKDLVAVRDKAGAKNIALPPLNR